MAREAAPSFFVGSLGEQDIWVCLKDAVEIPKVVIVAIRLAMARSVATVQVDIPIARVINADLNDGSDDEEQAEDGELNFDTSDEFFTNYWLQRRVMLDSTRFRAFVEALKDVWKDVCDVELEGKIR